MIINEILNELNKEQFEAATHIDGAMYVIAGAGTGKTKTLTARIVNLIKKGARPNSILAMTFTNKATKEMRERLNSTIGNKSFEVQINTFHSFAAKVLRNQVEHFTNGIRRGFAILDDSDSTSLLKDAMKEALEETIEYFLELSFGQNDVTEELKTLTPKVVKTEISKFKSLEKTIMGITVYENHYFKLVHEKYQKKLVSNNSMDFDDLMVYLYELLKNKSFLKMFYNNNIDFILVDEFQDTNKIQFEILKLLVNEKNNIFAVGDPDQSIYAFRGARYENNNLFFEEFKAKKVVLQKNYRSTNKVLEAANSLISHNHKNGENKKLISDLGQGEEITVRSFGSSDDEVEFVINEIEKHLVNGVKADDIAILYRNNFLSRAFEQELVRQKYTYKIYGGLSFFERMEVKDIIAYARVVMDPNMFIFLKRVINTPKRKIGKTTLDKIEKHMNENGTNFFDSYKKVKLSTATYKNIERFIDIIEKMSVVLNNDKNGPVEFFETLIEETNYYNYLDENFDKEVANDKKMNVEELVTVFVKGFNYYEGNNFERFDQILEEVSLMSDRDKNDGREEDIILSTYHQVKGLEFKVVFMIAMEDSIFPNMSRLESVFELEEERRIAYVGLTRSKEHLYLTNSNERMIYGRRTYARKSPFIEESGLEEEFKWF